MEPDFAIWRLPGRQLKAPSGTIWETAVFQILAGEPFGARFWQFAGFPAPSKRAFWDYWDTAVLGQILAGSLLEPECGHLRASRRQVNAPSGTIGKRPVLGQILARSLLEPNFGNVRASRSAIKLAFWDDWGNGRFGPNPDREPFGAKFWQFAGFWKPRGKLLGSFGNSRILAVSRRPGRQLNAPSGTIGKRPFWAKSWPGAFWSQILAICGLPGGK